MGIHIHATRASNGWLVSCTIGGKEYSASHFGRKTAEMFLARQLLRIGVHPGAFTSSGALQRVARLTEPLAPLADMPHAPEPVPVVTEAPAPAPATRKASAVRRPPDDVDILTAMRSPGLFGPLFKGESWLAWQAALAALFGLPMSDTELELFRKCTGRTEPPAEQFREACWVVGRRGGKSRVLALIAVWLACFRDYRPYLAPGETGVIAIIAHNRQQAKIILSYIVGTLASTPALASLVAEELAETVRLTNGVTVEIHTGSISAPRGRTFIAVLADEIAFWKAEDSTNPDSEVIAAVKPGLASIPSSVLLMASSPYARRGVLFDTFTKHYARDDSRVLVWKADTETMNSAIDPDYVAQQYEDDPANAAAEYGAEFRSDIAAFVAREVVEQCTVPGRHELPPSHGIINYVAFVDPSGGSSDSMTLAIAHHADGLAVLDAVREIRPPFSPDVVVKEMAELLRSYNVHQVVGDRYAGEWCREKFRENGLAYELSEKAKSDIYRDALPMLNSGKCELLDNKRLGAQLCGLERRTARGGRDSIDHGPGQHDDIANAVCGALLLAQKPKPTGYGWIDLNHMAR